MTRSSSSCPQSDLLRVLAPRRRRVYGRAAAHQGRALHREATNFLAILVARADELRQLAIVNKQISAGVAAVKEIGILTGLRIDRREVGSPGEFDRLTDEELRAFIASVTAKLIELPGEDG